MPRSEPVYLGEKDHALAAWLHRAQRASSTGVVVCNPFGYEAICAYRSLRHLAEGMAAKGLPTLRFDYTGTGDSPDLEPNADGTEENALTRWVRDTRHACRELRRLTGVEHIVLVGVRLGAMVATLAAADETERIDGLVAVAPVVSGRAYVRELGLLQKALALQDPPSGAARLPDQAQESLGFVLDAATRQAISATNLEKTALPPNVDVLLLDRDDLPSGSAWAVELARPPASSSRVERKCVSGYVEMMLDPHETEIPRHLWREAIDWVEGRALRRPGSPSTDDGAPSASVLRAIEVAGVREEPVFVDAEKRIFGILTTPAGVPSGRAVILLNAGAVHHVGPNRLYVSLARACANAGHHVLRMDLCGIGESRPLDSATENFVYRRVAVDEIGAAISFLRTKNVHDIRTVGLCSGAYYAFRSALRHDDVSGYVAINPLIFHDPVEGAKVHSPAKDAARVERYSSSMLDGSKWKRVLRGEVRVKPVIEEVVRHTMARARKGARRLLGRGEELDRAMSELARRGVDQSFIFAGGDPGQRLLAEQAATSLPRLLRSDALVIDVIERTDHTFTPVWSHELLLSAVSRAIERRPRSAKRSPSSSHGSERASRSRAAG